MRLLEHALCAAYRTFALQDLQVSSFVIKWSFPLVIDNCRSNLRLLSRVVFFSCPDSDLEAGDNHGFNIFQRISNI